MSYVAVLPEELVGSGSGNGVCLSQTHLCCRDLSVALQHKAVAVEAVVLLSHAPVHEVLFWFVSGVHNMERPPIHIIVLPQRSQREWVLSGQFLVPHNGSLRNDRENILSAWSLQNELTS